MTKPTSIVLYEDAVAHFIAERLSLKNKKQPSMSPFFAGELAVIYKLLNTKLKFKHRRKAIVDSYASGEISFTAVQSSNQYKLYWFSKFHNSFENYSNSCEIPHKLYEIISSVLCSPVLYEEHAGNRFNYDVLSAKYLHQYGGYGTLPMSLDIADFTEELGRTIGFDHYDFSGIDAPEQKQKFNLFTMRNNHRTGFFFKKTRVFEHAFLFESI